MSLYMNREGSLCEWGGECMHWYNDSIKKPIGFKLGIFSSNCANRYKETSFWRINNIEKLVFWKIDSLMS